MGQLDRMIELTLNQVLSQTLNLSKRLLYLPIKHHISNQVHVEVVPGCPRSRQPPPISGDKPTTKIATASHCLIAEDPLTASLLSFRVDDYIKKATAHRYLVVVWGYGQGI